MKKSIDDYIDYKVGDWVETCHLMPGKVQVIDKSKGTVEVYYPHITEKQPDYVGGSCCSICHCGVHKIDSELAKAFLKVGEERVDRVYNFLQRNVNIKSLEKSIKYWEEVVNKLENIPIKEQQKYYNYFKNDNTYYYISLRQKIHSYQEYHKYKLKYYRDIVKEYDSKLSEAWQNFDKLFYQTIKDLANGVINVTTKGIWLSYQKHTIEKMKNGFRIIELVGTGERFLVKKQRHKFNFLKKLN